MFTPLGKLKNMLLISNQWNEPILSNSTITTTVSKSQSIRDRGELAKLFTSQQRKKPHNLLQCGKKNDKSKELQVLLSSLSVRHLMM